MGYVIRWLQQHRQQYITQRISSIYWLTTQEITQTYSTTAWWERWDSGEITSKKHATGLQHKALEYARWSSANNLYSCMLKDMLTFWKKINKNKCTFVCRHGEWRSAQFSNCESGWGEKLSLPLAQGVGIGVWWWEHRVEAADAGTCYPLKIGGTCNKFQKVKLSFNSSVFFRRCDSLLS